MKIYGVALLAVCFLVGKLLGNYLGAVLEIKGDIGGVGFAMLLLIVSNIFLTKKGWIIKETKTGILFWSSMFIPIVIAMAATQNVKAAISGGWIAFVAGGSVTIALFLLVPLVSKIGKKPDTQKLKV
ncbi:MAG: malonate transporter subunit MadL [Cyclobacteriaceae bacterium]